MSTSTLTTIVDTENKDDKKSSTQVILPTTGGLPNTTPIRARPPDKPPERRSRVHRPIGSGSTLGILPPYKFREPFTWQDGAMYDETALKQQFVTNLQEIPHVVGMLEEDMTDTDGFTGPNYYEPVMPGLTVPLGANEIWWFQEVIRWSGSGVAGTDQERFGWYTPLGCFMQGTGPQFDGSGSAYLQDMNLNQTLETRLEWESGLGLPEHQSGTQHLTWIEFYVTTGSSVGNLECGFTSITSPGSTVYAGTCLIGMRVSP